MVGIFGLSRDITARKLSEDRERDQADQLATLAGELAQLTLRDQLTGLFNLRGFEQMGNEAIAAAREIDAHVCVLFTDLDGLKAINDGYGHAAGDRALRDRRVATRWGDGHARSRVVGSTATR